MNEMKKAGHRSKPHLDSFSLLSYCQRGKQIRTREAIAILIFNWCRWQNAHTFVWPFNEHKSNIMSRAVARHWRCLWSTLRYSCRERPGKSVWVVVYMYPLKAGCTSCIDDATCRRLSITIICIMIDHGQSQPLIRPLLLCYSWYTFYLLCPIKLLLLSSVKIQ